MSKKNNKNNSKDLNKNNLSLYNNHKDDSEDTEPTPECDCHKVDCKSCRKNNTSNKDLL